MSRKSKQKLQKKAALSAAQAMPARTGREGFFSRVSDARFTVPAICILLAAMVWVVFGQTLGFEFINYDDGPYVYLSPEVIHGLSLHTIRWAFTHSDVYLWTPLTTISHMMDCQFFGLWAGGHHLTNVVLHAMTVILLYLALREMTGAQWRSAFVAAVFAIHPLRAESVAWVAERKDVLSGLFFVLTLGAYIRYVRHRSPARYAAMALVFALGLMAKQMLITLPCVLLLLDYWPLKRFDHAAGEGSGGIRIFLRLFVEKIPLFALSLASCVETITGAIPPAIVDPETPDVHPLLLRVCNAPLSCLVYLREMFYPVKLAVIYPYPVAVPAWEALGAAGVLAGITIAVVLFRKKHPEFLTGWLWYLVMLAPVIGFVPLGSEAHADRYTYLPGIGLCMALTWGVAGLGGKLQWPRWAWGALSAGVILSLMITARKQVSYWHDTESIFYHAIASTGDNFACHDYLGDDFLQKKRWDEAIAEFQKSLEIKPDDAGIVNNIGVALREKGMFEKAVAQFQKALEIRPDDAITLNNLGVALQRKGDLDGAIQQFQKAIKIKPDYPEAYCSLGMTLGMKGEPDAALAQFQKALAIKPDDENTLNNLGLALEQKGELENAIAQFQRALDANPGFAEAHYNLGLALAQKGQMEEAIAQLQKALDCNAGFVQAQSSLAFMLATSPQASLRNGPRAVALARQADEATGGKNPMIAGTLAAAYAECGQFPAAVQTAQRAWQLANNQSNGALADMLRSQIALYQARKPFRNGSPAK